MRGVRRRERGERGEMGEMGEMGERGVKIGYLAKVQDRKEELLVEQVETLF